MDFAKSTILCFGDVILDRFAYCETERISPEAPVPVLLLKRVESMLGGAGNAARNIASLGATARLVGLVGRDAAGDELRRRVAETPGFADHLVISDDRPTVCKTRYVAGHQQLVRIDEEQVHPLTAAEEVALLAGLDCALSGADAVILSDYGKSVLSPCLVATVIARARAEGVPSYVDPKTDNFAHYRGATCITPNLKELALAARMPVGTDAEVAAAARKVMRDAEAEAILTTRSDKGMLLVEADGAVHVEPTRAREVYDVSGAGDTVIAVLALARAAGYPMPRAMQLANTAAGIVVGKLGTAPIEREELRAALASRPTAPDAAPAAYHSATEAEELVRRWKSRGYSVGFTNGCFDILHAGHVSLLHAARAQCDRLIVALNSDPSVRRLKGSERPVNGLPDRAAVIAALGSVDAVVSFDEDTPLELIRRLRPDVLIKGGDYSIETIVGAEDVQGWGGRVVIAELVDGYSTTRLIQTLRVAPEKPTLKEHRPASRRRTG